MGYFLDLNIPSFGDERHTRAVVKAAQKRKVRRLTPANQSRVFTTVNGVVMSVQDYVAYDGV